jgi:formylglycine-generating enzyme required for sulfatase activity/serine/threonine protein kinase
MLAPDTILQDRYRIVSLLGKGGMGAVYQAVDQKFGSTVAIKETLVSGDELARAFEREARLLNKLRHGALPMVMDYFAEDQGQFLVMQYIPGDDLATLGARNDGPFPQQTVLRWAEQLLDALSYLHEHEPPIIHRDIKPQNLKLTPRGEVILLDFGLSKSAASAGASLAPTSVSVLGYTPHYAPFEQINSVGTDPRSDLFSLAATLYHLLTGDLPPDAMTRAQRVMNGQPDPLRPAHVVNDAVAPAVAAVLHSAMAINREHRPASAAAMYEALCKAQKTTPSEAHVGLDQSFAPTLVTPALVTPSLSVHGTVSAPVVASLSVNTNAPVSPTDRQGMPAPATLAVVTPTSHRFWLRGTALGVMTLAVMGVGWFGARLMHKTEATTSQAAFIENPKFVPVQTTGLPVATFKFETVKLGTSGSVEDKRTALGKFYEEDLGNGTRLDMVLIPAGTYLMGTPDSETEYADEHPQHQVSVPQFYLGQFEVTQAQWRAVTTLPKVRVALNPQPSEFKGDDLPVENISWDEANEFGARLSQKAGRNYRLPSEAEWEYAARAGTKTAFAFGDSLTTDIANFDGTAFYKPGRRGINRGKTIPVGSLKVANAFGLYDTHGNVWEWCFAKYHDNYVGAPTDGGSWVGGGDMGRRVVRGCSWNNLAVDCRSANRYSYSPDGKHNDIGFRVAMSIIRSDK